MKSIALAASLLLVAAPAAAYELKNLSPQDILTIGRGLDLLPRAETDANNLYRRIQQQLTEQDLAAAKAAADSKAKADADKEAEIRAKIAAEAAAKAKADAKADDQTQGDAK